MDFDTNKRTLRKGLMFLLDEGFSLTRISKTKSKASGLFYTASYQSEIARRSVIVSYFPKFDSARASIRDLDNEFTFGDAGSMKITDPKYDDISGEGLDKLAGYLIALENQLLTRYKGILLGEGFQNDEFDWSPYK